MTITRVYKMQLKTNPKKKLQYFKRHNVCCVFCNSRTLVCAKTRLTSVAIRIVIWIRDSISPQKFNRLFIDPLPTFPENFMQIRSEVFARKVANRQTDRQTNNQTNNDDYIT